MTFLQTFNFLFFFKFTFKCLFLFFLFFTHFKRGNLIPFVSRKLTA